jgi:uncharacterized RmlC-like cupin family protein
VCGSFTQGSWTPIGLRLRAGPAPLPSTSAGRGHEALGGSVTINPNPGTGAHHHGELERLIYVNKDGRGCAGENLEFTVEAGSGDFIYVPPFVPHQEINASTDGPLECALCAAGRNRSS